MKKKKFRYNFRKNKRVNHPAYLIDQDGNMYKYIGLTHSKVTDNVQNVKLSKNPDPKDKRPSYARPFVERDEKKNFGKGLNDWKLAPEDKKKIKKIIKKKQ